MNAEHWGGERERVGLGMSLSMCTLGMGRPGAGHAWHGKAPGMILCARSLASYPGGPSVHALYMYQEPPLYYLDVIWTRDQSRRAIECLILTRDQSRRANCGLVS